MEYKNLSIKELHEKLLNKDISVKELIKSVIEECEKEFGSNFLVSILKESALSSAESVDNNFDSNNMLCGIPYVTKDNIWAEGSLTTASTKILSNFISPEDATVTKTLRDHKTILIGKAALDELAMGGTGLFGYNGEVHNPLDDTRIAGGSSVGSAYAVAKGIVPFATGTDTGDSIRKPASYVGIVGFKPTYGSISRYGVIPYSPSLDHVGFFTKNVNDMKYICGATYGYDKKDFTSIENEFKTNNSQKKIAYLKPVMQYLKPEIKNKYLELFKKLTENGYEVIEVDFRKDLLDAIPFLYMMISFSEGVSTSANLDGINFANRIEGSSFEEVMTNTRSDGFGAVVKKRFVMGSYQLQRENQIELLDKAKKIRRILKEELDKVYEQADFLIVPPSYDVAPLIKDIKNKEIEDEALSEDAFLNDILITANFNGMPSITIPFVTKNNLPIGVNISSYIKNDFDLLDVANEIETIIKDMNREVL